MKEIWNKSFICSFWILKLFCSAWLFAKEDQSSDGWDIEDYKKIIISKYNSFEILEFEEFFAFDTGEKLFLCMESDRSSYLFSFNNQLEFRKFYYIGRSENEHITEILTSGLPGVRIWYSLATIGDFNNDGHNEIAALILRDSAYRFWILGIDIGNKDIVYYFDQEFYVDWPPTFPAVEFMKYRGIDGFKMLRIIPPSERASIKYPFQEKYNDLSWFFYAWDEEERQYVIVEEINPDYSLESSEVIDINIVDLTKIEQQENEFEEISVSTHVDNGKDNDFSLSIGIIVSIILFVSIVFIMVKKRKSIKN